MMNRKLNVLVALIVAIAFLTSATPMFASSTTNKENTKKTSSSKSKSKKKSKSKSKKTEKKSTTDKKNNKKDKKDKKDKNSSSKTKSTKKKSTAGNKKTTAKPFKGKLNINKASREELMQLPGIGEAKADAIIKARKKGKFKSADDLQKNVQGIGDQTVKKIKRHLTF